MAEITNNYPMIGIKEPNNNRRSRDAGSKMKITYLTNLGDVDLTDPSRKDYTVSKDQVLLGASDGSMTLTNTIDCGEIP